MDRGYFLYYSTENPDKYLAFNKSGRPIKYSQDPSTIDKQCRKIYKRITEDSSNGLSKSTIDYEQTSVANNKDHNRHKSSTRTHPKTHRNRIETSKSRSTSKRKSQHHVRHHHNEQPLRHSDTISNKDKDMSSTKQLGNEDLNAIYNRSDSGINTISEGKGSRHLKKPTQSVPRLPADEQNLDLSPHNKNNPDPTNDNLGRDENNNDTNNCTYNTKNTEDETDDKYLRGRKIVKGRNGSEKPNNKCNNNRRHRKNNGNSRKPSQKASSHKNQQANP